MDVVLNQHSFLVLGILAAAAVWVVVRRRSRWLRRIAFGATVALIVLLVVALRPGTGDVRDPEDLDRALARGAPVALEFYSNW